MSVYVIQDIIRVKIQFNGNITGILSNNLTHAQAVSSRPNCLGLEKEANDVHACTRVFIPTIVYVTHGQRVAAIITINVVIGYLSDHSRVKLVNKSDFRRKSFTIS